MSEPVQQDQEYDPYDPKNVYPTCDACGGDGMEDDITPCTKCEGEGYMWWME